MINLMPDSAKKEIRSARTNVILLRYIVVILSAFGFLALLMAGSYIVLTQTKISATQFTGSSDTKSEAYITAKTQVDALNTSLLETRSAIAQEIRYSTILTNIGQSMPAGTVVETMTLHASSPTGTPVTLKAYAKTANEIETLKSVLQSSPHFTNVSFETPPEAKSIDGYPIGISITLIAKKVNTL